MVWTTLQAALEIVLTLEAVLALFGGVVIGTLIGAIPGMTVTMGVALTLPFTFGMHPAVESFCCSASIRAASTAGRSRRS